MDLVFDIGLALLSGFLSFGFYWLMGNAKSLRPDTDVDPSEITEEHQNLYLEILTLSFVTYGVFTAGATFILFYVLVQIKEVYLSFMKPYLAMEDLGNAAIFLPALFQAMVSTSILTALVLRKKYGEKDYRILRFMYAKRQGFDEEKLYVPALKWGTVICLAFYINVLKDISYVYEDRVVINSFFSLKSKTYPLEQIQEITIAEKQIAPTGKITNTPLYVINFKDGFRCDLPKYERKSTDRFIKALIQKSGVKERNVELYR